MRLFEIKPRYLKAFKVCKFLNELELDFAKRQREYNKLKKEKKNVSKK